MAGPAMTQFASHRSEGGLNATPATHTHTGHTRPAASGAGRGGGAACDAALGGYGMSAITALTAQNTLGVQGVHAAPTSFVELQIDLVVTDLGV